MIGQKRYHGTKTRQDFKRAFYHWDTLILKPQKVSVLSLSVLLWAWCEFNYVQLLINIKSAKPWFKCIEAELINVLHNLMVVWSKMIGLKWSQSTITRQDFYTTKGPSPQSNMFYCVLGVNSTVFNLFAHECQILIQIYAYLILCT